MGFRALSCNVVRIKIESRREKERGREQQPYFFFFFFLLYNFLGSSHALGKLLFLLMVPKKHVVGDLFFFFSLSLSISNTHTLLFWCFYAFVKGIKACYQACDPIHNYHTNQIFNSHWSPSSPIANSHHLSRYADTPCCINAQYNPFLFFLITMLISGTGLWESHSHPPLLFFFIIYAPIASTLCFLSH